MTLILFILLSQLDNFLLLGTEGKLGKTHFGKVMVLNLYTTNNELTWVFVKEGNVYEYSASAELFRYELGLSSLPNHRHKTVSFKDFQWFK